MELPVGSTDLLFVSSEDEWQVAYRGFLGDLSEMVPDPAVPMAAAVNGAPGRSESSGEDGPDHDGHGGVSLASKDEVVQPVCFDS